MLAKVYCRIGKGNLTCYATFPNRLGNLSQYDCLHSGSETRTFFGKKGILYDIFLPVYCYFQTEQWYLFVNHFLRRNYKKHRFPVILSSKRKQTVEIILQDVSRNRQMLGIFHCAPFNGADFGCMKQWNVLFFILALFRNGNGCLYS